MKVCIMIQAHFGRDDPHRLTHGLPRMIEEINSFASGNSELLFRSSDSGLFAFMMETEKPLPVMRSAMEGQLRDGEGVLVFEIGDASDGWGSLTRQATWLRHR